MLLLTSCTSSPKVEKPRPKVPDPFVNDECVITFNADETVVMPLWYWKEIVLYISTVEIWYLEEETIQAKGKNK